MEEENEQQQYQKKMQKRVMDAIKRSQLEEKKKEIIKRILDPGAFERMMNIRVSNPELYDQLINMLISLMQSNRIQGKIDEAQFKSLLEKVTNRHEPTIEFRHK